ncbi:sporulation protein SsgA [Streptomyces cinnamoneus]|uniref:Sporulation protein SsgA n=1 Tax=Streptomyces cinnamoneus TaxID=53446 RepID=A0A2G1XF72_STRCJ|nr:SsgA family sporulation/cell division regulator [Streptomyces cinnamoneus]PHQ49851.1 sporulation protein SsgA [Streptomyces cinnamoneus]PPT13373.1 SsgA family sporulation/cell division regulator [Streptomyces cinnamoneus]
MHIVVERSLDLDMVLSAGRSIPVPARLSYRSADPLAVHITFHVRSDRPVTWTFARDLLVEGVFRAVGEGDVRVFPGMEAGRAVVGVALSSPEGRALLRAPAGPLAQWLERTLRAVPAGAERGWLALDEGLAELLASGA